MKFTQALIIAAAASTELWALTSAAAVNSDSTTLETRTGRPTETHTRPETRTETGHHATHTGKPHHKSGDILTVLRDPKDLECVKWTNGASGKGRVGLVTVGKDHCDGKSHPSHTHTAAEHHTKKTDTAHTETKTDTAHTESKTDTAHTESKTDATHTGTKSEGPKPTNYLPNERRAPTSAPTETKTILTQTAQSKTAPHGGDPTGKPVPGVEVPHFSKYENGPKIDTFDAQYQCIDGQAAIAADEDVKALASAACSDLAAHVPHDKKGDEAWEIWQQVSKANTFGVQPPGTAKVDFGVRSFGTAPAFSPQLCEAAIESLIQECKSEAGENTVGGLVRVDSADKKGHLAFLVDPQSS